MLTVNVFILPGLIEKNDLELQNNYPKNKFYRDIIRKIILTNSWQDKMSDNLFRFPPQIHSIHRTASRSWPFILQQPILASAVWRQSTEKRLFLSSYMKKKHYTRDNCVFWGNIRCPAALGILLIIPNLPDKKPERIYEIKLPGLPTPHQASSGARPPGLWPLRR